MDFKSRVSWKRREDVSYVIVKIKVSVRCGMGDMNNKKDNKVVYYSVIK